MSTQNTPAGALPARAARVPLFSLHHVEFRVTQGVDLPVIRLANISTSGLGFLRESPAPWPVPGSLIEGELVFESTAMPVSVKVVHVSERVVGAVFVSPPPSLRDVVKQYFKVELAALSLMETPSEMLNEEPDGVPRWLHGNNNCELFLVSNDGKIVRFSLTVFGLIIEWFGEDKPPRFGELVEDENDRGNHMSTPLIGKPSASKEDLIATAERFVQSIPQLGDDQKAFISRQIRR